MKRILTLTTTMAIFSVLIACSGGKGTRALQKENQRLRDSLELMKNPADKRLATIKSLINNESYPAAKKEIDDLLLKFPSSTEADEAKSMISVVENRIKEQAAEAERVKAQGFKAIKQSSTAIIDYNTVQITKISYGSYYFHDNDGRTNYYSYAENGSYILANMSVTSTDKNPKLPQLAVYSISGDSMTLIDRFTTNFAKWQSPDTFLGNTADAGNDFAK